MLWFGKGKKELNKKYTNVYVYIAPIGFSKDTLLEAFRKLDLPPIEGNEEIFSRGKTSFFIYFPLHKKKVVLKRIKKLKFLKLSKHHGGDVFFDKGTSRSHVYIPGVGGVSGDQLKSHVDNESVWFS